MNYKVLYRKYRPTNFENIIGQDYIIKTLKNSIINNCISHAYIFSGPRGTGKTSTAKVFAKAINCLENTSGSPCEKCEFCCNFLENPDIIEIDAASNNGVEEIRGLIDNIKLTPTNGKYKIYIIDEVHMLTISAFNALLLTLEEPPAHAIFILATTNIESVPITILSRCQRFDFQKIKLDDLILGLKNVCEKEAIEVEESALREIAYLSEGGMRDALSLLDQLSKNNKMITLELVEKQIKTISIRNINELLDTVESNDIEKFLNLINDYRLRSLDYKTIIKKIIDVSTTRVRNIKRTGQFKRLSFNDYKKLILALSEGLTKININVDPYTIIEMIILELFDSTSTLVKNEIINHEDKEIEKNNNIENQNVNSKTSELNDEFINELINIRINNCFVNAQKTYLEVTKKIINDIVTKINESGKIISILLDSKVVAASDKNIILTSNNEHLVLSANKLLNDIENVIKKETNKEYKLIFITEQKWQYEKEQYINNLKINKKYEYISENTTKQNQPEIEISDVFDISKVEVI